jgi:MFS family permease
MMSHQRQKLHLRRNYLLHAVEGGVFIGTIALVNRTTVLPTVVEGLGGPDWLISLMPVLGPVAMMIPPLLTAHLVQRLLLFKPLLLITGIGQRAPYLVAGLVLFWAGAVPNIALAAVVLTPLISGLSGGVSIAAWQQLVAKTVPSERRSSLHAMRNLIAAGLGLAAGLVTRQVLAWNAGPVGYAWLHLIAFGGLVVSYTLFAMIREWAHKPPREERRPMSFVENLKQSRQMLSSRQLVLFLVSMSLMNGFYVVLAFLPLRALHLTGADASFAGVLTMTQMAGGIAGNILVGWIGDRFGSRSVMLLARGLFLGVFALALTATTSWAWGGIYALLGVALAAHMVSRSTMPLDLCPARRRSTVLGVIALVQAPTMIAAPLLGGWARDRLLDTGGLTKLAFAAVLVSTIPALLLREPRKTRRAAV